MKKPVYIDITNLPKLERYTGISRVTSEVAAKLIANGGDIRLMSYSVPDHAYKLIDNDHFLQMINGLLDDKTKCYTDTLLYPEEFQEDSVFFELNSSWHTLPDRSWLLPILKNRRIRIVCLIYDLIPIRFPQYMVSQTLVRFMEFLTAHMTYADKIIVTSDAVKEDILQLYSQLGMTPKPMEKIVLGADFSAGKKNNPSAETVDPEITKIADSSRFILSVGTIEPRKNQKILVEAYQKKLSDMGIGLIFVGRIGWQMEELLERIQSDKNYNNGLYILNKVNDATLQYLYSKAFMIAFPSYTEGYGLPTIEALINGVPIACSDIGVMREVGGDFADYFDPDDSDQLISAVSKYADSPELYAAKRKEIAEKYSPPVWADTVAAMEKIIYDGEDSEKFPHKPVKQVVFLSARPAPILATLPYVEEFMPFITELVVCCPDDMADFLKSKYTGRLKLTTVTDDQLLAGRNLPPDHSTRNFFLRCLAMELDVIDDEFIMCDDDYRPLRPVTEEFFYSGGRYNGYYFSDISGWKYRIGRIFSYDRCHFRTLGFLKSHGYATLQYSSHMPQIINKQWYRELINKYPDIITKGYDEWSTYFNYIASEHPQQYRALPYVTLSWPNVGGNPMGVVQPEYVFENFYISNYYAGHAFAGYHKSFADAETLLAENKEKAEISRQFIDIHEENRRYAEKLEKEYEDTYGDLPYFSAYFSGGRSDVPSLGIPCSVTLSRSRDNQLKFSVARSSFTAANFYDVIMQLTVIDSKDNVYSGCTVRFSPDQEYSRSMIRFDPENPPETTLRLRVTVSLENSGTYGERTIPAVITD